MLQTINGFQVLRKIADSNTAEIFHVVQWDGRNRGGEFAVKLLRPAFRHDRTERARLQTEYRVVSRLDHPNIVHIYDLQIATKQPFLVMDYVAGPSLRQLVEEGPPTLADAIKWLAQVAAGLAHCHDRGYLHRDVKPQNIVVGDDGVAKVIDFALAVPQDASFVRYWFRRLHERRRPGTWSYMAPEQIQSRRLTGQTDVYGLGVTLYAAVTGQVPYVADAPQQLMEMHLWSPVPVMRSVRPSVPLELDEFVRSMMAKDPLDRPVGMGYVSGKLRSLAALCRAND